MLISKIRGTKEQLRLLGESFRLHWRAVRKIEAGQLEVPAVLEDHEVSFLEVKGYGVTVLDDVADLLNRRVKADSGRVALSPGDGLFQSAESSSAYMDIDYIESWNHNLASLYPMFCACIEAPEKTWEGRATSAIRVRAGDASDRPAILITSGVHAAELGGPDSCIQFLYRLLSAYTTRSAIVLGNQTVTFSQVEAMVETLDIFVFPCVNPDGRSYVMDSKNWWRKNRNPQVGMDAAGVDVNRNFDFLWASGIGSSFVPADDTYKGASPFSEPETRNMRWFLEQSGADFFLDIHGYAGQVDQTWGDAPNQTLDSTMSFRNPAWDGRRGSPYREYIETGDQSLIRSLGGRMAGAANSVAKGQYESDQSFADLYPTTGTSDDYAYSRHLLDAVNKTYAYTLEYGGTDFFPPYGEMLTIVKEVNAVMLELCDAMVAIATQSRVAPPLSGR